MDGDRQPQIPSNGPQANPNLNPTDRVNNPPSLSEPSQLRRPALPATEATAQIQNAPLPPAPTLQASQDGFYRAAEPDNISVTDDYYDEQADDEASAPTEETVSWTSTGEDLQGHAASWRIKMLGITLVIAGLIYLLTRDLTNAVLIIIAGLVFGLLGSRKPHPLQYVLDSHGISIGQKRYGYGEFRAFSVAGGNTLAGHQPSPTINLVPLRRFLPILSVHFDQAQSERIVNLLAVHLPMEAPRHDAIDKIVSRIKF